MTAKVRVPSNSVALGGWKGRLEFAEDVIRVLGDDPTKCLEIDPAAVKRCSFNSNNGLWAFRMKDGKKVHRQTSGIILSADRSAEGKAATARFGALLAKHNIPGFSI